jgi:ArsR family transcriptional regulator
MKRTRVEIDNKKLEVSSEILRALAHPLRIKILGFIDQHDELNVNKIYNTLRLEQSITSQHLRIMRNAGIVHAKRDGKYMHYSINYDKIDKVVHAVKRFVMHEHSAKE